IFAQLQEPAVARRSSLEALGQIVAGPNPASAVEAWDLCRVLIDAHLIQVGDESAPRSGWQLRVPAPVWGAIKGEETGRPTPRARYRPPSSFAPLADLILAPDLRDQLKRIPPL